MAEEVNQRPRVSAVVLRDNGREVLMVQHKRRTGESYWQLPGGGVLPGEPLETAVLRELLEETGLVGRVACWLFTIPYKHGTSTTFLVDIASDLQVALGADPEEEGADHRKLVAVAWQSLLNAPASPEVEILRVVLGYHLKLPKLQNHNNENRSRLT